MPCFYPLKGVLHVHANGTRKLLFNMPLSAVKPPDEVIQVPCGQCIGCRLERSRKWAMRCVMEASMHKENCFITLTYRDDSLPRNGDGWKRDFVLFMKRLRKAYGKVRFFHCGEYGELNGRPHHHSILFGLDFDDRDRECVDGKQFFRSKKLSALWPYGFASVGDMSFESAAYVARYCMKKVNGPEAAAHYKGWPPEYITMSRRPGIAEAWYRKFAGDVYPLDRCFARGVPCKPPRYFDEKFRLQFPEEFAKLKAVRKQMALRLSDDNSPERLQVKEELARRRLSQTTRFL